MAITISEAVIELLQIVDQLQQLHPKKKFTLDGRLVGDIGEMLVEAKYEISLFEDMRRWHDGVTPDGRQVQIKTTMKDSLTFPADHIPEYYLGIKIARDDTFQEVFNGPGIIASEAIKNRRTPKTNLHSISVRMLIALSLKVSAQDRISVRGERGETLQRSQDFPERGKRAL